MITALFTTVLDFLLMTWIFWPIILTLPLVAYYNVTDSVKEEESEFLAGFLIAAIVGALVYKFPALRGYFDGWRACLVVFGGYIAAGFLLSLYKWLSVLWDFRKQDVRNKIEECRIDYSVAEEKYKTKKESGERFNPEPDSVEDRVENLFKKCNVEKNEDGTFTVFPNWKQYPIGIWWVYWPFFLLELPFDFVKRVMERLFNWLRHFYNGIAKSFAVKA